MASPPLTHLDLTATSRSEDSSFVALADIANALEAEGQTDYRIIGGHMVSALVGRWELGRDLYRDTGDADLGIRPQAIADTGFVERLYAAGYVKVAGDRFERAIVERSSARVIDQVPLTASIDILLPAKTSRLNPNRRIAKDIVATEVPGLMTVLRRPPVVVTATLHRLNGEAMKAELRLPDEVGALTLKALATTVRQKNTDIVDLWRCLEIAYAAAIRPEMFTGIDEQRAAQVIRHQFADKRSLGASTIAGTKGLSDEATARLATRLRALVQRVVSAPDLTF